MSSFPDHGINDPDVLRDQLQGLPGADALLAGTLALMTAYAKSCCDGCRELIARKIVSNLAELSQETSAAPPFRAMAQSLHGAWTHQLEALRAGAEQGAEETTHPAAIPRAPAETALATRLTKTLWHTTPETIQ